VPQVRRLREPLRPPGTVPRTVAVAAAPPSPDIVLFRYLESAAFHLRVHTDRFSQAGNAAAVRRLFRVRGGGWPLLRAV
jgi:hypothetical protein